MKSIKRIIAIFIMFLLVISSIGCKEEHTHKFVDGLCECGEKQQGEVVDVNFLNGHLNINGYISSNYQKKITSNDILLLDEQTTSNFDGSKYIVKSVVKKLDASGEYLTTNEEDQKTEASKLSLVLKEKYFDDVLIKLDSFEANIVDDYLNEFLGVNAKDGNITIKFGKDFIVKNISISYKDIESNFIVSITVSYSYE